MAEFAHTPSATLLGCTVAVLRLVYDVPLQELRRVGAWLHEKHEAPWSSLRLGVIVGTSKTEAIENRQPRKAPRSRIVFYDSDGGTFREAGGLGQGVIDFHIEPIAHGMREVASRLRDRGDRVGKIERHRNILGNSPTIAGIRIRTEAIWKFHVAGYDTDAIIKEYPRLTPEDVQAAIEFEERNRAAA